MRSTDKHKPRTARGEATRGRIVDAAAKLMRRGGVANTSVDMVLEASDTSKSQLYHYFTDKDELVLAVIRRQTERVLATHAAYLSHVTSVAGLRRWRDDVVELTRRGNCAGGCPLGSLVSELAETPRTRALLGDGFTRWEAAIVDRLRAIGGDGTPTRDVELADLALTLLASLEGGLLLAQTMRTTRPLELALDAAIDHVASHLAPPTRRARPASARTRNGSRSRR